MTYAHRHSWSSSPCDGATCTPSVTANFKTSRFRRRVRGHDECRVNDHSTSWRKSPMSTVISCAIHTPYIHLCVPRFASLIPTAEGFLQSLARCSNSLGKSFINSQFNFFPFITFQSKTSKGFDVYQLFSKVSRPSLSTSGCRNSRRTFCDSRTPVRGENSVGSFIEMSYVINVIRSTYGRMQEKVSL